MECRFDTLQVVFGWAENCLTILMIKEITIGYLNLF